MFKNVFIAVYFYAKITISSWSKSASNVALVTAHSFKLFTLAY